jgi:hypothetical protein
VGYFRKSFFAGEEFADLAAARRQAERWCLSTAGLRIHGTTQRRPLEGVPHRGGPNAVAGAAVVLRPAHLRRTEGPSGLPHRGGQGSVLGAHPYIGCHVKVRADRHLVRIYHRGRLIKTHPRARVGGRHTDEADLPPEKAAYATRDPERLKRAAGAHGRSIGAMAAAVVLDGPLPWTRMRRVYRLLGLVRRYGEARVDAACARALELEAADVSLVARIVEKAREAGGHPAVRDGDVGHRPGQLDPLLEERDRPEVVLVPDDLLGERVLPRLGERAALDRVVSVEPDPSAFHSTIGPSIAGSGIGLPLQD